LLLTIASPPDEELAKQQGIYGQIRARQRQRDPVQEIVGLIDIGKLQAIIEKEFSLGEAAFSDESSETGQVRGKIILTIGECFARDGRGKCDVIGRSDKFRN
jgi:hypothetical protein